MPRRARRARPTDRLVTLTSDLGAAYAAQMKAVLARYLAAGRVVDLAHDLRRHAVDEAGFLLRAMAGGFPRGTVHVAVVDPGVGGRRAPLAVDCTDGSVLIGPDNGVLAPLAEQLGVRRAYRLDPARIGGAPRVGTTFDGRDLCAPAAGLVAQGTRPASLGAPASWFRPAVARARRRRGGASGRVVHLDRFGNAVTDVPTEWVPSHVASITLRYARGKRVLPWVTSYETAGRGRLAALGSSFGTVELSVAEGSALRRLRLALGASVRFTW